MPNYDDPPIFSPKEEIHLPDFGWFICLEMIGEGGFGAVFTCVRKGDGGSGKVYAFKTMHPEYSSNPEKLAQFKRECAVIVSLRRHRNICEVHGVFDTAATATRPSVPVIVMTYLSGVSVRACMSRELRPIFQAQIASQLLKGLEALHDAGIVHRDIKPENAFLDEGGNGSREVVLLDFGIIHVLGEPFQTGKVEGSPGYMSPAQWHGQLPTILDDIYAASVVFYELFSGTRLFPNVNYEDHYALANAHMAVTPVPLKQLIAPLPPDAPPGTVHPVLPEVIEMIERGLSKDPAKRPANASEYLVPFAKMERRLRRIGSTETLQDMYVRAPAHSETEMRVSGTAVVKNLMLRGATTAPSSMPPQYPPVMAAPRIEPPVSAVAVHREVVASGPSSSPHYVSRKPTIPYDFGPVTPQRAQVSATTTTTTPSTLPRMEKTIERRPSMPSPPSSRRRNWVLVAGVSAGIVLLTASGVMGFRHGSAGGEAANSPPASPVPIAVAASAPVRAAPLPPSSQVVSVAAVQPETSTVPPSAPAVHSAPVATIAPASASPGGRPATKRTAQPARAAHEDDNDAELIISHLPPTTPAKKGPAKSVPSALPTTATLKDSDIFPNLQATPAKSDPGPGF